MSIFKALEFEFCDGRFSSDGPRFEELVLGLCRDAQDAFDLWQFLVDPAFRIGIESGKGLLDDVDARVII